MANDVIEAVWPAEIEGMRISYSDLRNRMRTELTESGAEPGRFSHFGIVVEDVSATLEKLAVEVDPEWRGLPTKWAEAFGCHIARRVEDGVEFEVIQPDGDSFLKSFLLERGPGLQHLSYEVADIEKSLAALRAAGAEMADPDIHKGLHGSIAFARPNGFGGLCVELCQP